MHAIWVTCKREYAKLRRSVTSNPRNLALWIIYVHSHADFMLVRTPLTEFSFYIFTNQTSGVVKISLDYLKLNLRLKWEFAFCVTLTHEYSIIWIDINSTHLLNRLRFLNPNTNRLLIGSVVLTHLLDFINVKRKIQILVLI